MQKKVPYPWNSRIAELVPKTAVADPICSLRWDHQKRLIYFHEINDQEATYGPDIVLGAELQWWARKIFALKELSAYREDK